MRPFMILTLCLALLAPTFSSAQQDKSCDASPRWLLVTVVRSASWFKTTSKVEEADYSGEEKLWLVDRCGDDLFNITSYSGPEKGIATEIMSMTTSHDGEALAWTRLSVKESLHDICRAMRDCGDATSKP